MEGEKKKTGKMSSRWGSKNSFKSSNGDKENQASPEAKIKDKPKKVSIFSARRLFPSLLKQSKF